jgi:aminocarboxymuconate-semialdehyde decarboxylase
MPAIDVHNHVIPENFPDMPSTCCTNAWPSMKLRPDGKSVICFGAKEFRVLDNRSWDTARRIAEMDDEQVDMQALSPMPELLSYWMNSDEAQEVGRYVNGTISKMVERAPARFIGLGMVPLQDPELAARELSYLKSELGLTGVEIGSNILGKPPGHAGFDVFYAEAERLDMPIFVHALHPTGKDRIVGASRLETFLNFPVDTGFAAASIVTGRTLEKFPRLRIGFSHGGGTFAAVLPRLVMGWERNKELKSSFAQPAEIARKLFYDNLVYDLALMRHIVHVFGRDQIMLGTDYPFDARQSFPVKYAEALGLTPGDWEALKGRNAARFLGLGEH